MKRLLLLATLLMFALGGVQSALAAPFAFGPSSFDDELGLKANLETLATGGTIIQESSLSPSQLGFSYFKLMAVSNGAIAANFALYDANDNVVTSAATIAADWGSDLAGDLAGYTIKYDGGPAAGIALSAAINLVYTFGDDIVYQPEGQAGVIIEGGTFFLGLSLPGNNDGIDFVLAFSDAPFAPAVPVPAAVWLMGTGLAGIVALRKRANQA